MGITAFLAQYITAFIDKTGYITIFIGMVMESMFFPIPSEAIMPFAGFLIVSHRFSFFGVILVSTLASLVGSLLSYYIGAYGGRPFVNKFGRYFLIDHEELEATEKFFARFGESTIFISRFIPVVRHLISLPAGIARMNIWRFMLLTVIGAGLWNAFLTVVGYKLQQNWEIVMTYSHYVDLVVVGILLILMGMYIWRYLKKRKKV